MQVLPAGASAHGCIWFAAAEQTIYTHVRRLQPAALETWSPITNETGLYNEEEVSCTELIVNG